MKKKVLIILGWILVWQIGAILVNNKILLVGPLQVLSALFFMLQKSAFWTSLTFTMSRIILGTIAGMLSGILFAWISYQKPLIKDILQPVVLFLKAVPVVSFIVLILIAFGNTILSLLISLIVVFPIFYINTLEGLLHTDIKMLELAEVFEIKPLSKIKVIYFRSVYPYLLSALELACGMAIKSGIAAEVIGQARNTIGNNIYQSKIYFSTDELLAWTFVVLLLSWLYEKILLILFRKVEPK